MMEIGEETAGGVRIIALTGRLDALAAPAVEDRLLKAIADGDRRVVLDLAGLLHVGSIGLRAFMTAAKRMKAVGGSIVIAGLTPPLRQVFEIAGFDRLFTLFATREEAVRAQTP